MNLKELGSIIVGTIKMVGKLTWITPNLYVQKKRAIKIFRAQLELKGVDEEALAVLTETYQELGNPKSWLGITSGKD